MRPNDVQKIVDFLLRQLTESEKHLKEGVSYRYVSDYYRIKSEIPLEEDNRRVVLNRLEEYPAVEFCLTIDEISEEYNRIMTRETMRFYREWAYRYGSKGRHLDDVSVPDVGDPTDFSCRVICELNDKIEETDKYTVNDASLAFKLAGEIVDDSEVFDTGVFNSDRYNQVKLITEEIQSFIVGRDVGRLEWDMLAKTFDGVRDRTQQDIMEDLGKRRIIRRLKDTDTDSIAEFLKNRDKYGAKRNNNL